MADLQAKALITPAILGEPRSKSLTGLHRSQWFSAYRHLPLGGHAQTLVGNYWRSRPFALPFQESGVEVDPSDGSRVLCHCHWQPERVRADRLTIVLVHGLEGSSESRYILRITAGAWAAGCNVIRMNMRNCGGTEDWTPTLYHSGLSADVGAVMEHFVRLYGLRQVAMAGYSMGGNLVLKLAGELGNNAPAWLLAAVGVSPATDLAASADALHEPRNRVYEWHFLRGLMRRFARKAALYPAVYKPREIGPVRTIREFDHEITARYSGFEGADDYYFQSSSARVVAQIAIPTLVIHALDDPFIRMMGATRTGLEKNDCVALVETARGGHCAFLARRESTGIGETGDARHWAEDTLLRFLLAVSGLAELERAGANGG